MNKILGFLADRPVKFKLFTAFGILTLLIIGLAADGWLGQEAISDRVAKADDINRIVKRLQSARVAEKNFDLRGDEEYAQQVSSVSSDIIEMATDLEGRFDRDHNKQAMQRIRELVEAYLAEFEKFEQSAQSRADALKEMRAAARKAEADLNELGEEFTTTMSGLLSRNAAARSVEQAVKRAEDASLMIRWVLAARVAEKNFILFNDPAFLDVISEKLSQLRDAATKLGGQIRSPVRSEKLSKVLVGVRNYENALNSYVALAESTKTNREQMVTVAREAMGIAEDVRADQKAQVESLKSAIATRTLAVNIFAIVFAVLAAVVITRLIVPPLLQARSMAIRIADGDLTAEAPPASKDEVGELMRALHRMVTGLREIMNQLASSSQEVSSSSEELSVVTNRTKEGVQTQDEEIEQMATALEQMTSTIQEVAQNAETAAGEAEIAKESANQGETLVVESRSSIRELSEEVAKAAEMIDEVREESNSVSGVIEVIEGIAEQTNLLALNAAIEAARAGEHGRGFAVVSDEVRNLSQKTQESTENITQLIKTLQEKAAAAVQAMKENESTAEAAAMKGDKAAEALRQITEVIEKLSDMNTQTASAATEQSSVAEEISRSVQKVRDISEQTMTGANETNSASQELARLAHTLQNLISRFKL